MMNFVVAVTTNLLLLLAAPQLCASQAAPKRSLRGGVAEAIITPDGASRVLYPAHDCTLVFVETEYDNFEEPEGEEEILECELSKYDAAIVGRMFVPVNGLQHYQTSQITSGVTTLISGAAMIMDGELHIPADAAVQFGTVYNSTDIIVRRRLQSKQTGEKRVLVIRADAQDSRTKASISDLEDDVFGRRGNQVNLKTQYQACSHGQLQIEPFQGYTDTGVYVENGVVEVTLPADVKDQNRFRVENAVEYVAFQKFGDLRDQFDHVMICLPPGTTNSGKNWIAYAYVNSWLSVYNDHWCSRVSTQVHEFGHTLNLGHSGIGDASYADKSGMMGFSYDWIQRPVQCFNPAKNWQLGWYSDQAITVNPFLPQGFEGTLVGITDYTFGQTPGEYVVLKIPGENGMDMFVGYNRRKLFNRGTQQGIDKILIVEQGKGYSESNKLRQLSPSQRYTVDNYLGSGLRLVIWFKETITVDKATVVIRTVKD